MFWGLIMEPMRRYSQVVKKPFHISMAALDVSSSSDEPAQVMCGFEGRNYLLCTLSKRDLLQCPLDLNFSVGDELSLATNGKCHVHLTGYLQEEPFEYLDEEEEEDVEEELEEKEVKIKNKKRNKSQLQNGPPSKKIKPEKQDEESEEEDDDDSDVDVKALLENTFDSDEDDATFDSDQGDDEEGDEEEAEEEEDEDEEESSLSEGDSGEETVLPQKRNIGKVNGTPQQQEQQSPKQKKEKKNKKNQQDKDDKHTPIKESQSPKKDSPKKINQNGLIIEDLKEGQGPPAKPGKFINVYYEGRLKSSNKVFDSARKGQGFSFRLGGGEVIKAWDAGLVGMKMGGKRRITCPPQMAYGAKGSPPAIPGNATLVFEVELRKIR